MDTNEHESLWQFPPLRSLCKIEVSEFLTEHPFSVIHIDASWDGYAAIVATKVVACSEADSDVGFATMDCDAEQEYAKEVPVLNVPAVLYFRGADLVAQVIGMKQDVAANIEKLKAREPIDQTNRLSRG
jgi:hypothetical protein